MRAPEFLGSGEMLWRGCVLELNPKEKDLPVGVGRPLIVFTTKPHRPQPSVGCIAVYLETKPERS